MARTLTATLSNWKCIVEIQSWALRSDCLSPNLRAYELTDMLANLTNTFVPWFLYLI